MPLTTQQSSPGLARDLTAGVVVFLVALPLCLGIALASNAPLLSGVLAGIIGGIIVGLLSGSHTSVSGPAAGLAAVVAAQMAALGSFETFLLAVTLAGLVQVGLGIGRAGFLAAFFPSSVIKGLLAAIGVLLILKQLPHVFGHDPDPEGELAFQQPDQENTFSELVQTVGDLHLGPAVIGLVSVCVLIAWGRVKILKRSPVPAPLVVVLLGVALALLFDRLGGVWAIEPTQLVQVPVADSPAALLGYLRSPDFSSWRNPAVYSAALTLAAVASLETLLNLEAVDKLDPRQRTSPPNRELIAQGVGNVVSGLVGGLPITSVVVRSSVNVNAGARSKLSAVIHGLLLLVSVALFGAWLNRVPLSCLAAVLVVTGVKLASPDLVRRMWQEGKYQFAPFVTTVLAIVFTDLLVGVLIGLAVSTGFILWSSVRRPIRRVVERHLGGEVVRIVLPSQVSFLNRAGLTRALSAVPPGGHVLLDARDADYIDPDILDVIRDFKEQAGPAHRVEVSLLGFRSRYQLEDQIQYVDYSTRELQSAVTPAQVLEILRAGAERFRSGRRLTRDLSRQVIATADGQHPLAVILSCIDSRAPAELIFDLGVGDILSVRVAGNVTSPEVLGSIEYSCAVAGVRLVVVMGHTRCGAVTAAVNSSISGEADVSASGCGHLHPIVHAIQQSLPGTTGESTDSPTSIDALIDDVARRNVRNSLHRMRTDSPTLAALASARRVAIVGAMYDVTTGTVEFLN